MKPFNLERAIAGDKVVTREGKDVRFIGNFPELIGQTVLAIVGSDTYAFYARGNMRSGSQDDYDLFMAPKITTQCVNIYRNGLGKFYTGDVHESKDTAARARCDDRCDDRLVKTISFEVEE